MVEGLNSTTGINSIQFFRAKSAFNNVQNLAQNQEQNENNEVTREYDEVKASTPEELSREKLVSELKGELLNINEDITDEDIKYGLTFGRSVLIDCSA